MSIKIFRVTHIAADLIHQVHASEIASRAQFRVEFIVENVLLVSPHRMQMGE